MPAVRPRRSVLYMPGSSARALEKARTLAADGLVLDLEDAVAPAAKAEARALVLAALSRGGYGFRETVVRVIFDHPIEPGDLTRQQVATEAHRRVASLLGLPSPGTAPARGGDRPAGHR